MFLQTAAHAFPDISAVDDRLDESAVDDRLHELLTVADVAALLKVPRSWVYEHTRSRTVCAVDRLPVLKLGKYVRFDPDDVREFLRRRNKFR